MAILFQGFTAWYSAVEKAELTFGSGGGEKPQVASYHFSQSIEGAIKVRIIEVLGGGCTAEEWAIVE